PPASLRSAISPGGAWPRWIGPGPGGNAFLRDGLLRARAIAPQPRDRAAQPALRDVEEPRRPAGRVVPTRSGRDARADGARGHRVGPDGSGSRGTWPRW